MKKKIISAAILVVVIIAATFFIFDAKEDATPPKDDVAKNEVVVYVSGQVKTPAVVTLEDNGNLRLIDAVNAVGGLTELADSESINLAENLIDGQHVHIPTKEIFFRELSAPSNNSSNLININTADAKELEKIKGVGPALAGRIIDYRTNNGAFKSIDEIKKVRGIGEKTFDKMKDQITV
ncbi:MAG: helix-hairpin-helix domain-containing protein [Selenomonadaceae bacterium]|nr:helix-hairpin-helix domain-containing protein [Selenomonadaceae bacterium]